MERPGTKLKRTREQLRLTYRDVEEASQHIAGLRGSDEFSIALSRLADIENKGTVPTIYRLYSLCAIYRLDLDEVLKWYGVPVERLASEAFQLGLDETHRVQFAPDGPVAAPQLREEGINSNQTTFLSPMIREWGRMPLSLLRGLDARRYGYGLIGLEDRSMYPILQPGSLVLIDQGRRKIAVDGWTDEYDRPIYFLERRGGYLCGWCAATGGRLVVQPHPASQGSAAVFEPKEIDVIGQVIGVATLLDFKKRRLARTSTAPAKSPDR